MHVLVFLLTMAVDHIVVRGIDVRKLCTFVRSLSRSMTHNQEVLEYTSALSILGIMKPEPESAVIATRSYRFNRRQ